jgi:hypothetical protein
MTNDKKKSIKLNRDRYVALFVMLVSLLPFMQSKVTWLSESLTSSQIFSGSYTSSNQTGPIKIPTIETSEDGVLKMKFRFILSESSAEWPNLFQTSDVNYGIRGEIRNGTVQGGANTFGIVYAKNEAGELEGISLSDNFQFGIQHELSIEAKRNEYIIAQLDGVKIERRVPVPNYKTDNILVGQGFNGERVFSGDISNYEIKYIQNQKQVQSVYFAINGFLFILVLLLLRRDIKKLVFKRE